MSRYIKDTDVYKLVEPNGMARVHCSQIDELPRADVVEVVRCKDCVFRVKDDVGRYYCELGEFYVGETDFCSRGERREK